MGRLIILIGMIFLVMAGYRYINRQPPEVRKKLLLQYGMWALIGILALLAVTGRLHWIGVAIAAMIPLTKHLVGFAIRVLPFLQPYLKRKQQQNQQQQSEQQQNQRPPQPQSNMAAEEALQVLGLEEGASKEEIISSHRRLMQKLHPDRGGNDYLAARINLAKDVLLK